MIGEIGQVAEWTMIAVFVFLFISLAAWWIASIIWRSSRSKE